MMCLFVGNVGSVIAKIENFPLTIENCGYYICINGVCVYDDEEADEDYVQEVYNNLMQTLAITLKGHYPCDDVVVVQVGD